VKSPNLICTVFCYLKTDLSRQKTWSALTKTLQMDKMAIITSNITCSPRFNNKGQAVT